MGHFGLSQDLPLKCWDTSHCPKTSHSSVGTLRTVPRPPTQVLGHFALPKTTCSSFGTLRTVPRHPLKCWDTSHFPRPFLQVLGHFALSQDPSSKCWDTSYFALSQDLPLKCWDISHCPKSSHSSVGTLRSVPRLPAQVLEHFVRSQDLFVLVLGCFTLSQDLFRDTSHCPKTSYSSVGTLRTVPGPPTQVLGHFALSQDLPLKCWDTSYYCPKTSHSSVGTLRTVPRSPCLFKCWDSSDCPKTCHSSVGTLRTVPRPFLQVLGHFVLSQDLPVCLSVGTLRTVPRPPLKC